tara:strand:+ start:958 stop:2325 length:1368 start_codon:yes stop_codon:yes gene_type:complete
MSIINLITFKQSIKDLFYNHTPRFVKVKLCTLLDFDITRLRSNIGIRAENYFEACKKELVKNNSNGNINRYLQKAFNKHMVRSNLIDNNWWSDFILLINLPEGLEFQKVNQSLIDKIEYSNFNSLEYYEILDIYALCLRLSLFELGYHLRKKSIRVALEYCPSLKKNESWKLKAKLSALLEIGNFSEFDQLFPLYKVKKNQEKYFLAYLRELLGDIKNPLATSLTHNIDSEQDQKFRKFVENKKIVIVGPAPVNTKDGNEIDKADIVLRTNYKMGDSVIKGSKCDINYFNLETSQHINTNGCLDWPPDIKWIVGKAWNYIEIIIKRLSADGINIEHINERILKRVDLALFNGSLSLVQNIIVDLSRYNPKEIFLYHFDVMLSKERISGYYTDVNNNKELHLKMIKCFPGHDPVTQFLILKSFWKLGFIRGDYRFEEVMKMEAEDYMKNMQKNYRH